MSYASAKSLDLQLPHRQDSLDEIDNKETKIGLYCTLDGEGIENTNNNINKNKGSNPAKGSNQKSGGLNLRMDKTYPSVHQGFLTKQGGTIKNWKKRFFTLRTNKVLYYYRDINKEPQGEIDLNDNLFSIRAGSCEDGCWSKIPFKRTLVLDTTNRRYYLYSETVQEADTWLERITNVRNKPNTPNVKEKSQTLPAQGRSATVGQFGRSLKITPNLSPITAEDCSSFTKPRTLTSSAKFQVLPAVPIRAKISEDVSQYYGDLPVHEKKLAEMRNEANEHYSNPNYLLDDTHMSEGGGQLEKRRSELYKCRSVEDFVTSSTYEVSKLLESQEDEATCVTTETLYDCPDTGETRDELYGLVINGNETTTTKCETTSNRPRMELPEITDYCITKQPIPDSMRRALLPLNPEKNHTQQQQHQQQQQQKKNSAGSLGVGVYSMIQPEEIIEAPIPKPRSVTLSINKDCLYDEVPVEEFYDEINAETRAELFDINTNKNEVNSNNTQPNNDYETLQQSSTYDEACGCIQDTTYDILTDDKPDSPLPVIKIKSTDGIISKSRTNSPPISPLNSGVFSPIRKVTSNNPTSPQATRRKQDPLPPVPNSPRPIASPNKPVLSKSTDNNLKEQTISANNSDTDEKPVVTPYTGPDPLSDSLDFPVFIVNEDVCLNSDTQVIPKYSKVNRSYTVASKSSAGTDLFQKKRNELIKTSSTNSGNDLSTECVDLSEEEKKLERLRRECNREEKKNERIEGELKMKKKFDEIRKDQELIQQRLQGIRAKNIDMMVEVGKDDLKGVKSGTNDANDDMERIKIEREKLEIEKERQKLEREKLAMERERSEMEKMKLEHQKLLLERERFMFEKEKLDLEKARMECLTRSESQTSEI
ncbi:Auxilin-related protein 1-like [Oopsacas minuta]|uniref:Auxilin-related protein 1-like n=1 Tax=Oopsacas minuta TaxID=111878 RepID=A0AAV7K9Z8_9METZ|nr:Auxilin-related protein 1-like [Oopsacas minuta]